MSGIIEQQPFWPTNSIRDSTSNPEINFELIFLLIFSPVENDRQLPKLHFPSTLVISKIRLKPLGKSTWWVVVNISFVQGIIWGNDLIIYQYASYSGEILRDNLPKRPLSLDLKVLRQHSWDVRYQHLWESKQPTPKNATKEITASESLKRSCVLNS